MSVPPVQSDKDKEVVALSADVVLKLWASFDSLLSFSFLFLFIWPLFDAEDTGKVSGKPP